MQPLDQKAVRKAFVNASKSRAASATFPQEWPPAGVEDLDFVGWSDPKAPQRAYVVVDGAVAADVTAIELRLSTSAGTVRKTMCDWCHSQDSGEGARLMVARRAGRRGKAGDTVGLYVCADFGCSRRARVPLKAHQLSVSGAPDRRVPELVERVRDFVLRVGGD